MNVTMTYGRNMDKSQNTLQATSNDPQASKEDLDRILAVGRILMSVLTEEEIKQLQVLLSQTQNR